MTDTNRRLFWRVVQKLALIADYFPAEPLLRLYNVF